MSSPEVDALRALLVASRNKFEPELRGLRSLANDAMPQEAINAVNQEIQQLTAFQQAVQQGENALNQLDAVNFPNLPVMVVTPEVLDAINGDKSDVEAGAATFVVPSPPPVSGGDIKLTVFQDTAT